MPNLIDDLTTALQSGARAGAAAASTGAKDLTGDVETFVVPHLRDIAVEVASILEKREAGILSDVTAKDLLDSQKDAVEILVETITTLAVFEAQTIVNATLKALAASVDTAIGVALL